MPWEADDRLYISMSLVEALVVALEAWAVEFDTLDVVSGRPRGVQCLIVPSDARMKPLVCLVRARTCDNQRRHAVHVPSWLSHELADP